MKFPLTLVIGAALAFLCWLLAAYSARLWNRRFYLKAGLQVLCAAASLLTLLYALTFVSSDSIAASVHQRLEAWQEEAKSNAVWQDEAFKTAYDEVARVGSEPTVKKTPTPRTDSSITRLPMTSAATRLTVARSFANSAKSYFQDRCPYLTSILNVPGEVPDEVLKTDLVDWFTANPGTDYPQERSITLLVKLLVADADAQIKPVVSYTQRLSWVLFAITQLVVFSLIALFAYRSIRPTR